MQGERGLADDAGISLEEVSKQEHASVSTGCPSAAQTLVIRRYAQQFQHSCSQAGMKHSAQKGILQRTEWR